MRKALLILAVLASLAGCARTRLNQWEAEDARWAAQTAVSRLVAGDWLAEYFSGKTRPPLLLIGSLEDQCSPYGGMAGLREELERELLFTAGFRLARLRDTAGVDTAQADSSFFRELAEESGAEYILQGSLNCRREKRTRCFALSLELVKFPSGGICWQDSLTLSKAPKVKLPGQSRPDDHE